MMRRWPCSLAARRARGSRITLGPAHGAVDRGPVRRAPGAEAAQAASDRRMLGTLPGFGIRDSGLATTELVADYAAFVALEAEWNDAVERAQIAHPFLRHEWVRTWWD